MASRGHPDIGLARERGQASLLMLGVVAALLAGALILFAFGQALGAKSREQRAADLSAVSAAAAMRRVYARLFEASGIPYVELLDRLVELAIERHAAESVYRH